MTFRHAQKRTKTRLVWHWPGHGNALARESISCSKRLNGWSSTCRFSTPYGKKVQIVTRENLNFIAQIFTLLPLLKTLVPCKNVSYRLQFPGLSTVDSFNVQLGKGINAAYSDDYSQEGWVSLPLFADLSPYTAIPCTASIELARSSKTPFSTRLVRYVFMSNLSDVDKDWCLVYFEIMEFWG